MIIDSHCHLNFIDLSEFGTTDEVIQRAKAADVGLFLSVCVELSDFPVLETLAERYPEVYISAGVHPNTEMEEEVSSDALIGLAQNPKCIAIGETGLDYYRVLEADAQELQRHRFKEHIKAARETDKPLIIHTRQAAEDTLKVMQQEGADEPGGVMHCFAEDLDVAERAIDLNFYISFSGILTFKNAINLQNVAKKIPLDRILVETDSPYLAPVPFRGKQNHPALVSYVARALAELRGISYEAVAEATTENFYRCFKRLA